MTGASLTSGDPALRCNSIPSRPGSVTSAHTTDEGSKGSSKRWKPTWRLSTSGKSSEQSSSSTLSRKLSSSTTASSRYSSASAKSSVSAESSRTSDGKRLLGKETKGPTTIESSLSAFETASDATLALQSLTTTVPGDDKDVGDGRCDEISPSTSRGASELANKSLPSMLRRSESRARSTGSKLSAIQRDATANFAEIELVGREYQGYWRATFTARVPPAAALCGCMLLTARLPARDSGLTTISVNPESTVWAGSLCEWLGEAETPDAALQILQKSSFETIVLAIRSSFNSGGMPTIPDKIAWTMYQKVAEVKNHPEKLSDLWGHISKLLKKVPEDIMCIIMFFLTIARRLQSRGVTIEDRPPAVFLLKDFFPRYVGEDMSKLLLKNFEHIPPDLPLTLRAVNYKLGSRRCNVLALVSSQKIVPASGAREIRAPEERQPEW